MIHPKSEKRIKSAEYDDIEVGDYGDEINHESNPIFQSVIMTKVDLSPPRQLEVVESTQESVTLSWITDSCAQAFSVTYSSQQSKIKSNILFVL